MDILAFDAAAASCSAALWRDGRIAAREWCAMERGHAEALVPMIGRVIGDTDYDALTAIAVTIGPGAFTGLRIALATARGLALATGVPAVGATSFAVIARMASESADRAGRVLVVALETKRADFYLQAFDSGGGDLTAPASVAAEDVVSWLPQHEGEIAVAGDAAGRLIRDLPVSVAALPIAEAVLPDASVLAAIVAERLEADGVSAHEAPLRPLYLRAPGVTLPKKRPRGG